MDVCKQKKRINNGGIIMLKKVMIICLAFSFVLIGGIGFALAGDCDGTQKRDRDRLKDGSCQLPFISNDSSMIIADGRDRDRLKDGSCQLPFISNDSGMIIADGRDRDRGRDHDRRRDGSCLNS
jgi:hypothetical protein